MKHHLSNAVAPYAQEFKKEGSTCLPADLLVSTFLPASLESLSKELYFRTNLTNDPNVTKALILKDGRLKDGMRAGLFYADTFLSPEASNLISEIAGKRVEVKDLFAQKITSGAGVESSQIGGANSVFVELQLNPHYFGGRLFEEDSGFLRFPTILPYTLYVARGDLAIGVEEVTKGERLTIVSKWS